MRIAAAPIPSIPAYVATTSNQRPTEGSTVAAPANFRPPKYVYNALGNPVLGRPPENKNVRIAEALARFFSGQIAEHLGHTAVVANSAIWVAIDWRKLRASLGQPGADRLQAGIDGTALAGDVMGLAGGLTGWTALEDLNAPVQFFAKIADEAHAGRAQPSWSDLAAAAPDGSSVQDLMEAIDVLSEADEKPA